MKSTFEFTFSLTVSFDNILATAATYHNIYHEVPLSDNCFPHMTQLAKAYNIKGNSCVTIATCICRTGKTTFEQN